MQGGGPAYVARTLRAGEKSAAPPMPERGMKEGRRERSRSRRRALSRTEELCWYKLQGFCAYGQGCAFAHSFHAIQAIDIKRASESVRCKFDSGGWCKRGDACLYSHASVPAAVKSSQVKPVRS